jgi:gas vesicle protein
MSVPHAPAAGPGSATSNFELEKEASMADGYDRFENEGGGGSFVMGLLTGTVLGAGLGMLFAPKAGSDLRNQISEQAGTLANTASEGYRKATEVAGEGYRKATDAAGDWADRGRDIVGKAREAAVKGADEAQRYVRDAASSVTGSGSTSSAAPGGTPAPQAYPGSSENIRGGGSSPASGGSHSGGSSGSGSSGPSGSRRS